MHLKHTQDSDDGNNNISNGVTEQWLRLDNQYDRSANSSVKRDATQDLETIISEFTLDTQRGDLVLQKMDMVHENPDGGETMLMLFFADDIPTDGFDGRYEQHAKFTHVGGTWSTTTLLPSTLTIDRHNLDAEGNPTETFSGTLRS